MAEGGVHGAGEGPEVRVAGAEDAAAVARLLHEFNLEYDEPTPGVAWLTARMAALLEAGEVLALVAEAADGGEETAGSAPPDPGEAGPLGLALLRFRPSLWADGGEAHLQELYVVPARRGEGLGRALLEATMDAAREAGATGIDLNTGETDTAARALYESAGFTNLEGPQRARMLFYEREL